jgi:cell division protein FtsN
MKSGEQRIQRNPPRRRARGGTLLGVFVGLALGLGIAAAVAYYLGKSGLTSPLPGAASTKEAARNGKADATVAQGAPEKPRFDFYKILPGGEEPKIVSERKSGERPADVVAKVPESMQSKAADRLWLQAGAFASESEAENLKARLALSGWEAAIQSATLPDKSIRYRVRLGPYDNTDELNRMKTELGKGGFDAAVIRNP